LFRLQSLAAARHARIADRRPRSIASPACLRHREEPLLEPHLSVPAALRASHRGLALRAARPATLLARLQPPDLDLLLHPEGRLFELQRHVVAQIAPALCPRGPPSAAAAAAHVEHLPEQVAEDVSQVALEPRARKWIPRIPAPLKRLMAVAVVRRALLRVAQHLVRLAARLEPLLGLRIVRVPVRMVLHRQPPVAGLQLLVARVPRNLQHIIKISLGHVCRRTHLLKFPAMFVVCVRVLVRHSSDCSSFWPERSRRPESPYLHLPLLLSLPLSLLTTHNCL